MFEMMPDIPESAVSAGLFYLLSAVMLGSGLMILLSDNIVRMAVYLLFTLSSVAALYLLLGAELLAAVQLIVYVGGILILIIFGVMLTSRELAVSASIPTGEKFGGLAIAGLIGLTMILAGLYAGLESRTLPVEVSEYEVREVGLALMTDFILPFEVAAVVLLVVMIAAAYMARKRNDDSLSDASETDPNEQSSHGGQA